MAALPKDHRAGVGGEVLRAGADRLAPRQDRRDARHLALDALPAAARLQPDEEAVSGKGGEKKRLTMISDKYIQWPVVA